MQYCVTHCIGQCNNGVWLNNNHDCDGILPKGPYPPCLRMADRALLAGYARLEMIMSGPLSGKQNHCLTELLIILFMIWMLCLPCIVCIDFVTSNMEWTNDLILETFVECWNSKDQWNLVQYFVMVCIGQCNNGVWLNNNHDCDGILPKGPYPPCLRMADRALLAGYPRWEMMKSGPLSGNQNHCLTELLIILFMIWMLCLPCIVCIDFVTSNMEWTSDLLLETFVECWKGPMKSCAVFCDGLYWTV